MVVKSHPQGEEGQSMIEFLIALPMMLGFAFMMVKVSAAIQSSIVNQKYARAQTLFLTFNSPIYPEKQYRDALTRGMNRLEIGISEDKFDESGQIAEAPTQTISRKGKPLGNNADQEADPKQRGKVRIRTTVAICTQSSWVGAEMKSIYDIDSEADSLRIEQLMADSSYRFCKGPEG